MERFIQLHLLTSYPPANLNRDDLGRPKTAKMGGVDRLRVSSQSLKRAWRCSEIFRNAVSQNEKYEIFETEYPANLGIRSKLFSTEWVNDLLTEKGIETEAAELWSKDLTRGFGKAEKEDNSLSQLAHISGLEAQGFYQSVLELPDFINNKKENELFSSIKGIQDTRATKKKAEDINKLNDKIGRLLSKEYLELGKTSVDIALFGRMLASSPAYNVEAACQVAHSISIHPVAIEDDYFTAVDDLNDGNDDAGAAHIGETGFAAGLFYSYVCINRELLIKNLGGDTSLADRSISALIEAAVKVAPEGKQNSFASRAYASYLLAEKGNQQPRSLSVAFLKPVTGSNGDDYGSEGVRALETQRENMDKVYGPCAEGSKSFNAITGEGSLNEVIKFVSE